MHYSILFQTSSPPLSAVVPDNINDPMQSGRTCEYKHNTFEKDDCKLSKNVINYNGARAQGRYNYGDTYIYVPFGKMDLRLSLDELYLIKTCTQTTTISNNKIN